MSDTAIRVENLSKRYRIGARQAGYSTMRETMTDLATAPLRRLRRLGQPTPPQETIWALKDVSFEVRQGEVVGIIGRNGAGKTTLLKVLCRITEPTEGSGEIHGRVGSLLEVGTGFHPELTGRENIYLNGAILGMKRMEIDRRFDEIVAFAEIEKFLDTPVKRYSSGMYVRLAFAVAAHLEPEILLVDEVLAVGDAAFQKKCLGKMGDVAREGRTVLFVSHNMVAVQSLCRRGIWLDEGKIVEDGQPDRVVSNYLQTSFSTVTEQVWDDIATAPGTDEARLHRVSVRPKDGSPSSPITMRTPLVLEFEFWNLVRGARLNVNFHLITEEGIVAFASTPTHEPVWFARPMPVGAFRSACHVPGDLLNSGMHRVLLRIVKNDYVIFQNEAALSFEVQDSPGRHGHWYGRGLGVVCPLLEWTTELVKGQAEIAVLTGGRKEESD